jgi:electron transport complex protein RnfA
MSGDPLWSIFVNACLINNFVLAYFLGICPFLGVSGKLATATRMGGAVTFVMLVSSTCAYGINQLLIAVDAPYLRLISFIAVIASTVQLVEMFIKKVSPALFRTLGIFLPLITAPSWGWRSSRPTRATISRSASSTLWAPAWGSRWRWS